MVLERNDRLGGCIRTDELFTGYHHDILSSWYPLFASSPAYAELGAELEARGLVLASGSRPTGVLTPDGRSLVLTTDRAENVRRMDALAPGDGQRFASELDHFRDHDSELVFGLLGSEPRSLRALVPVLRAARGRGAAEAASIGRSLESARTWLAGAFHSDLTRALVAPWILHAGLGPDDAASGLMARVILATFELTSMPVVRGGSGEAVRAFERLITDYGGVLRTDTDVAQVLVSDGQVRGVETTGGERLHADVVICNTTPTQLYARLLERQAVPDRVARDAARYRYGRADMQIHSPMATTPSRSTPIAGLHHIGASTHPGPGLGGVSGRLVAEQLTRPTTAVRAWKATGRWARRVGRSRAELQRGETSDSMFDHHSHPPLFC